MFAKLKDWRRIAMRFDRCAESAEVGNCRFLIMFATSMPSSVAAADLKDLKPHMGRTRRLIKR